MADIFFFFSVTYINQLFIRIIKQKLTIYYCIFYIKCIFCIFFIIYIFSFHLYCIIWLNCMFLREIILIYINFKFYTIFKISKLLNPRTGKFWFCVRECDREYLFLWFLLLTLTQNLIFSQEKLPSMFLDLINVIKTMNFQILIITN